MRKKSVKSGTKRRIYEEDQGVSPVIAVILMVAITVVMAAIVSSWSAGVRAPTTPTTVGLDIARNNNNITLVVTSIDPPSSAPVLFLNISYYKYDGTNYNLSYSNITNAEVGSSIDVATNSSTPKKMAITASYKDGSKRVIYSKEV